MEIIKSTGFNRKYSESETAQKKYMRGYDIGFRAGRESVSKPVEGARCPHCGRRNIFNPLQIWCDSCQNRW